MKTRLMIVAMLTAGTATVAQQVEVDDMYFTAKDRVALISKREVTRQSTIKTVEDKTPLNPTDSYSARNVNPEYISRTKMDPNQPVVAYSYFTPNYQPVAVNQNINNNYSSSNPWNDAYLNNPYNIYGSPYNSFGWNNPYYSGFNGFNNFYSPWSMSIGMGYGYGGWNSWGSPSMNFWNNYNSWNGYNSWGWNNPWGMNNYWSMNNWGSPWGYNYYGYTQPNVIVIDRGERSDIVYGKRSSRSSDVNNTVTYNDRSTNTVDSNGRTRGSNAGGRVSDGSSSTYYDRGWRSNSAAAGSTSTSGRTSTTTRSSSWGDSGNSSSGSWFDSGNSRGGRSSSGFDSNRSSFSTMDSGSGGRSSGVSSGGSSGGSSSGGARRGRD